jgi:hypothetical protein
MKEKIENIKIRKTVTYEIEVIETNEPIPKEQEIDFIEWLSSMTSECTTGKNHEYYSYTDNYKEDIGVTFYIRTI